MELDSVNVEEKGSVPIATKTVDGKKHQVMMSWPYPSVPGATQRDFNYDGDGNLAGFTFKDADGVTIATLTFTWSGGRITNQAWS